MARSITGFDGRESIGHLGRPWCRQHTDAQYSLGLLYDRGQGVPQDIVEASKWLNLSTAAGEAAPSIADGVARLAAARSV
ncbi:hypothetical protein [Bradyrhizobium sp. A5]|uniref:hypothetical protein n=1 Tax=Bradyrhizobium sp. A5 TaxID=3133696 RepID=UPI0035C7DF86